MICNLQDKEAYWIIVLLKEIFHRANCYAAGAPTSSNRAPNVKCFHNTHEYISPLCINTDYS